MDDNNKHLEDNENGNEDESTNKTKLVATNSFSRTPKIFDRFGSSSSSDEDFSPSPSYSNQINTNSTSSNGVVKAAGKKLDYMIQFLDRKLSKVNSNNGGGGSGGGGGGGSGGGTALPEFVGAGGGTGIFRLPVRSAVRPDRPPCVEVRPRPRRETQVGRRLKTIMCSENELWSGGESGVRCWELSEIFSATYDEEEVEEEERRGDEMTARFTESVKVSSEVLCMVVDEGARVVWSGHRDGRLMCWKMEDEKKKKNKNGFRECLSWQAHKGPVFSMVITSYGE